MSKRQIIIIFGALIIIIALFSGLPTMWNTTLYVIIGVLIIATAYTTKAVQNSTQADQKKIESVPYIDTHAPETIATPVTTVDAHK